MLFIEFGDRYRQASTYHQLGRVAEELRDYEQAQAYYQQSLEIYVEYGEEHNRAIVMRSFARLYQTTQDDTLLTTIAQCLNTTPAEVQQLLAAASV